MKGKNQNGASAVEFAILLIPLIVITFGIIEFSLLLYDKAIITNASREGARAGIVARYDSSGQYNPLTDAEIAEVVNTYCSNYLITFGGPTTVNTSVSYDDNEFPAGLSGGDDRKVTVSYNYTYLVLPNFVASLTDTININAETVMRME